MNIASNTLTAELRRSLLESCKNTKHLKQAHAHILKHDPSPFPYQSTLSFLLIFSSRSPSTTNLSYCKTLFSHLPNPTIFHYNPLIRGLSAGNSPQEAVFLFNSMSRRGCSPNHLTFPFVVKACSRCLAPRAGATVHAQIVRIGLESDPYIQSTLIHMYVTAGKDLSSARRVFDECCGAHTVCWNSMIDGFVKFGEIGIARAIFDRMQCRDIVSWNTMVNGYSLIGDLMEARALFDRMLHRNVVSWNSMLAGHSKCGDVEGACKIFRGMPWKDVVSWNAMIACYVQGGCSDKALALFDEMQRVNVQPTEATIVSLLSACAHIGALGPGERLCRLIRDHNMDLSTVLATALVDMYAKCGRVSQACRIFYAIEHKDVLSWNTIIAGMAIHGRAREALALFGEMIESGHRPDDITFVEVLTACSHAGMVREGRQLLSCMKVTYGIEPKVEHYGCLLDLLARKGLLEEAVEQMKAMPMKPNAAAWGALLGGSMIHGNPEIADRIGKQLLNLQPEYSGRYILLSNIYSRTNRWEDASKIRSMMVTRGITKTPGISVIELEGVRNSFVAGDLSHPESENIYGKLLEVSKRLKFEAGYWPDTQHVLLDIEEEEKEHFLSVHSEKLAIAFGLLHTSTGATIRVIKNLRICRDCHHVTKLISKLYCREIIMRDRNRFHSFKDGICSCMDYW